MPSPVLHSQEVVSTCHDTDATTWYLQEQGCHCHWWWHWDWQGNDRDVCTAWSQRCYNEQILAVAADVRDPSAVAAAVDRCLDKLGLPDIVINNAAGNFISPTEMLSTNAWKTIVDIVLNGTAIVTLDVGKRLIEAGKGANFLAISATYTKHGSGYVAPSAAAKSGVEALMMSLAAEWAKYGMRFNCIEPGPVYTKGAFSRLDPDGRFSKEAVKGAIERQGEIPEVVNLAAYLVSDYSSWLTGEVIRMDGGHLNYNASVFNRLSNVPKDQWKAIEAAIRSAKGS
ncbi:2,4-dienoyl-CoA reductase [(3E)-enoyl-CoA-producing], mitochondrial-like isoform X3 [Dermacentor albipictus]|uniref:2,4-dienoyl-CoA reductase [(3E)-enoyl-CoA-producing], mitochondrial-like isoform X3 n=1 Tax=Dermacentor albipictus TaxID=60249 RepID=UPI0031FCA35C